MKKLLIILSFFALLISCADGSKKKNSDAVNDTEVTTEIPLLALGEFDEKASEFLDKEIQVKGIVDHICKHGGKKILLVDDNGDVHVESEERFDDALVGDEITLNGVVTEFRVDEAYILKKEEDHLQNHKEGTDSKEMYDKKMKQLTFYRDSMSLTKVDHLSYYSLDYISHKVDKEGEKEEEKEHADEDNKGEGQKEDHEH